VKLLLSSIFISVFLFSAFSFVSLLLSFFNYRFEKSVESLFVKIGTILGCRGIAHAKRR